MKLVVAYVIESTTAIGSAFQLRELIRELSGTDFELHVVWFDAGKTQAESYFENANLHRLPSKRFAAAQAIELRKHLHTLRPDIVHAWGHSAQITCAIACTNHRSNLITSVFEKPSNEDTLSRKLTSWVNPHTVVVDHHTTLQSLNNSGIASNCVIRNIIGCNQSDKSTARTALIEAIGINSRENIYLAGTATSFEPRFRLKDLIWAIDLLCRVRQDVHLVVLGRGDNRGILRYLSKLECENNVHFVADSASPMEWIAGLDMYWNCQQQQALPAAMLYAMQHAVPTISILTDESRETILPLQSALATNYGSRDEFARWTKYLIEIPGAAEQIGMQGKQHVENMLLKQSMVDGYQKLYADLARTAKTQTGKM